MKWKKKSFIKYLENFMALTKIPTFISPKIKGFFKKLQNIHQTLVVKPYVNVYLQKLEYSMFFSLSSIIFLWYGFHFIVSLTKI